MAQETAASESKPPYLPYATFKNLIDGFRQGVLPARIDRSVMSGQSNGSQTYLISALKFFGLINDTLAPTKDLRELVEGDEAEQRTAWTRIFTKAYSFILANGLDLSRATESQVLEKISEKGPQGETAKKCFSFFAAAANDAGITLGHHLQPRKGARPGVRRPRRAVRSKTQDEVPPVDKVPLVHEGGHGVEKLLLEKFPNFDPSWSDDLKSKWFDGFEKLREAATK